MATKKKPKAIPKKKNVAKPQKPVTKHGGMTNHELEHQYKIELMRSCQIYGKNYDECKAYFESRGFTLGTTQFTELRNELKSSQNATEWFSKEALFVIEEDHMLSVERIRMMENRLLSEFEAVAATNFYKYINAGQADQEVIRNKAHDAQLLLRIIAQFQSLQETKTKMFSATPMVQEMMEVHARQEEEENNPTPTNPKTEKPITT